jgi:hypothetical protein
MRMGFSADFSRRDCEPAIQSYQAVVKLSAAQTNFLGPSGCIKMGTTEVPLRLGQDLPPAHTFQSKVQYWAPWQWLAERRDWINLKNWHRL